MKFMAITGTVGATLSTASVGSAVQTTALEECSKKFQEKIDKHGPIQDQEIKDLDTPEGKPAPDAKITYIFEDGSKHPAKYHDVDENTFRIKFANEEFDIDKERLTEKAKGQVEEGKEKVDRELDEKLKKPSSTSESDDAEEEK